jgi:hypothetical protein
MNMINELFKLKPDAHETMRVNESTGWKAVAAAVKMKTPICQHGAPGMITCGK